MRTIFNFLGPLTNPAGATRQLLGVSDRSYQETIADALLGLGCERALVVAADDGIDELSVAASTRVIEVADGGTEEWFVEAARLRSRAGAARASRRRRRRRRTPRSRVRSWRARRARARDLVAAQRRRRDLRRRRRRDLGGGVAKAAEAIDSGAARERARALDCRYRQLSARLGCPRSRWG